MPRRVHRRVALIISLLRNRRSRVSIGQPRRSLSLSLSFSLPPLSLILSKEEEEEEKKIQQESETTKKVIKEKVDIKKMSMGITKLRKGREGTVILGCETGEEMVKLRDTMQSKLGENYNVTELLQMKPKIKIIDISEKEMELNNDKLIHTVKKENSMDGSHIRIVKRVLRKKNKDNSQSRSKEKEGGSVIIEVDEVTHNLMLKKKINRLEKMSCIQSL